MNDPAPTLPDGTARPVLLWGAVLVLCCACLGLRLRGDVEVGSAKAGNTYYPQLLGRVAALLPNPRGEELVDAGAREHLARASATWRQARVVSAALSILIVLGTFLVARSFLTGGWSLVAAALVGTSLLHVVFSTQARPHGATSSFIILAVAAGLRLRRRGDVSSYLLAGAMAGCAVGALHYGVFALPPLAIAFLLRGKRPGRASGWWILAGIAVIALCVRIFYPFYFEGDRGFLRFGKVGDEATLNLSGQPLYLEKFTGEGFFVILETLWSYDPTLLFAGTLGLVVAACGRFTGARVPDRAQRRDLWVVLAHIVPYVFVIGMYQQTWERFVLQLLPYPAILAACSPGSSAACAPRETRAAR
jgi:4-amino-4-deoxy-L-arabinose transferase-like glycosyltransferase